MKNPAAVGRSIYLRPVERNDAEAFQVWMNDEAVVRNLLGHRPMTHDDELRFVERVTSGNDPNEVVFSIVRRRGDLHIGATGLHVIDWRRRMACFGIEIGRKEEWGKGYGTEATALMVRYAFQTLNLNRVWLWVYEFNERGIRAYERVGFKLEATLRKDCYRDGRFWDVHHMGILRAEWERAERRKKK
ncbi:MAG TPA: GNAT family protein [Candidatus Eisenbacteria bacterium]|nr:GNAT family protein [Candidatus Eisenbacteria bacterium]